MSDSNGVKKSGNAFRSFGCFLKTNYKTLALVVIVAVASVAVTTLISILLIDYDSEVYLPSLGTIKTIDVEVYWDSAGENRRENLTWNEITIHKLEQNEAEVNQANITVYIKSVSNLKVTLTMFPTDWNPTEISDYLTLSWDYDGTILKPSEIIPVTITLTASSSDEFINYLVENEVTRFDVDVHFVASE
jgi:hypothetical protein